MEQVFANKPLSLHEWEQAEIKRSAYEATQTEIADEALRDTESNIARYMSPPATTPFPLEYAYHVLGDVRGQLVVDFGCGTGENSLLLARRGAQVQAVDISPDLIDIARRRLTLNGIDCGVTFHTASVYEIPLPDASVDMVFGMAILHHLDMRLAARETWRLLKPGGRAIFQEPMRNSGFLRLLRKIFPNRAPDISPFERPLTNAEVNDFARDFSSCRIRPFYLPTHSLIRRVFKTPETVRPWATRDAHWLERFPALEHYATVKVIELTK